ncbi:MAG: TRAP transporter permease, partial [Mesorhizobium sp.]
MTETPTVLSPTVEEPLEGLPPGFGEGIAGKAAFLIAVAFSVFQIYIAAYGSLPSQVVRAMHVGFLLLLGFGLIANLRAAGMPAKALFWTLGALGFATGLYN